MESMGPLTAHTAKKHEILARYLVPYLRILSRSFPDEEILYVDGFAGSSVYDDDREGSPIVALRTIYECDYAKDCPRTSPVRVVFVEEDEKKYATLLQQVSQFCADEGFRSEIVVEPPMRGDCATLVRELIRKKTARGRPLGPALFFFDQYGYTQVPMSLIQEILRHKKCEVFTYLNLKMLKAYVTDASKATVITEAFGSDSWARAESRRGVDRTEILKEEYERSLRAVGAHHVLGFTMAGTDGWPIYRLFHASTNPKAQEAMKKAMRKVDPSGSFSFSDKAGGGVALFDLGDTPETVAERLSEAFRGRTDGVRLREVEAFVGETGLSSHVPPLVLLERADRLSFSGAARSRRFCFPTKLRDSLVIRFR